VGSSEKRVEMLMLMLMLMLYSDVHYFPGDGILWLDSAGEL
jgi:hypothetical protein